MRRSAISSCLIVGATLAVLGTSSPAIAVPGDPAAPSGPVVPDLPDPAMPVPDDPESQAEAEAKATGEDVVVEELTSESTLVTAKPDGTFVMEASAVPERVQQSGEWVDVDTDLALTADGYAPEATVMPTVFSAGGSNELARVQSQSGAWLSISWDHGVLPEPEIDGASATYPDVFSGVDLVLSATESGFTQVLVIEDAQAAANPELDAVTFSYAGEGLATQPGPGGTMAATAADGSAAITIGAPAYWDSSSDDSSVTGPAPEATPVPLEASQSTDGTVTLDASPNEATAATYPLYVDPVVEGGTAAWAFVDSAYPNQSYWAGAGSSDSLAHVGYINAANSADGKAHTTRSFWNLATWGAKY